MQTRNVFIINRKFEKIMKFFVLFLAIVTAALAAPQYGGHHGGGHHGGGK